MSLYALVYFDPRESLYQLFYTITVDGEVLSPLVAKIPDLSTIVAKFLSSSIAGARGLYTIITEAINFVRVSSTIELVLDSSLSLSDHDILTIYLQEYFRSLDISELLVPRQDPIFSSST